MAIFHVIKLHNSLSVAYQIFMAESHQHIKAVVNNKSVNSSFFYIPQIHEKINLSAHLKIEK
jgi:hypothetical protein